MPPERPSQNVLARALAVETGRLDELRVRAWLLLGAATAVASAMLGIGDVRAGLAGVGLGGATAAWFALRPRAVAAGDHRAARLVDLIFEAGLTPGILGLLAVFTGGRDALNGFGPTLVFAGVLMLSLLRLQPRVTLAVGGANVALYTLVAVGILSIEPASSLDPAHGPLGLALRVLAFLIAVAATAGVSYGLRSAMGAVVKTVREKDLFGRYRLEHELAQGGMGVVWSATYCPEGGFERPAAVKLIHAHLVTDAAFVDAFRAEAALCASLVHDAIVQVFDFGRVDGRYFLAMERVDGLTLSQLMRRAREERLAIPDAVTGAVARALLAALGFAHEEARDVRGKRLRVVHRDVAPSNILVSTRGAVKLTDFGIAKVLGDRRAAETQTVVGHIDHMAPEQVAAAALDARTDLFCAGVVLWEMVCGRSLFRRDTEVGTLAAIAACVVPAPSSIDSAWAHWDSYFARALAREPAARFQTAAAMAAALPASALGAPEDVAAMTSRLGPPAPDPDATKPMRSAH